MEVGRDGVVYILEVYTFDRDIVSLDGDSFCTNRVGCQSSSSVPRGQPIVITEDVYIVPIYHQSFCELEGTRIDLGVVGLHERQ